jgi:hypothetical protein
LFARVTSKLAGPGPVSYAINRTLGSGPKHTLKSRHPEEARPLTAPYRVIPSAVGERPKASLASRHSSRTPSDTPSPTYLPPPFGTDARRLALSSRRAGSRDPSADNPGPGAYSIEPRFARDANRFTLHQRTRTAEPGAASPGPGAYSPDFGAVRHRPPAASMHIRPSDPARDATAGYVNLRSTLTRRGCTIGRRETLDIIPI